jgi:hypothetical protein
MGKDDQNPQAAAADSGDDSYPPYNVKLIGLGETKVLTGTHFSRIEQSDPQLTVRLEHVETTLEAGPVLKITFERG